MSAFRNSVSAVKQHAHERDGTVRQQEYEHQGVRARLVIGQPQQNQCYYQGNLAGKDPAPPLSQQGCKEGYFDMVG